MDLDLDPERRYDELGLLGEGGMGEVHACLDRAIGRVIARKSIRALPGGGPPRTEARAEFLRETRVQGQLEHPAVVPVYDVGRDPAGNVFFTMKRVAGQTLADVVDMLRTDDEEIARRFGRHRLLTAFQLVCQCIDYAHSRGVVHRDLKPPNVMFGDFGEVYVLDWGVALVAEDRGERPHVRTGIPDVSTGIRGTPGYMAPEMLTEDARLDARTDVYALGAILFEILTFERLHVGSDVVELVASTRHGADARASVRAPERDVPPELEAVCVRATAFDPAERYASVRDLYDEVEQFLDGRRDLELRSQIAARHVVEARRLAETALGPGGTAEDRSRALGEVGRALALRPESPEAADVFARLITTPPPELPREAAEAIAAQENEEGASASRLAGWLFAAMALYTVVGLFLAEVRGAATVLIFCGAATLASVIGFWNASRRSDALGIAIIALAGVAIGATSGVLGPLVMTPVLALGLGVITMNAGRLSRFRPLFLTFACLVVAVPAVLEWSGAIPTSYVNLDGSWLVVSKIVEVPSDRSYPFGLLLGSLMAIAGASLFVWRMGDRIRDLRRDLHLHAWHLRQLVPEEARRSTSARSQAPPAPDSASRA